MSDVTQRQAKQTLNILDQSGLNREETDVLHKYLPILAKVIKKGVAPPTEQFHEVVGLGPLAHLAHHEDFTIGERDNPDDPHKFLKTCGGLFVWGDFRDLVLKHAKQLKSLPPMTLASFDLVQPSNNGEIRKELPKNHIFEDVDEFCALLALHRHTPMGWQRR